MQVLHHVITVPSGESASYYGALINGNFSGPGFAYFGDEKYVGHFMKGRFNGNGALWKTESLAFCDACVAQMKLSGVFTDDELTSGEVKWCRIGRFTSSYLIRQIASRRKISRSILTAGTPATRDFIRGL